MKYKIRHKQDGWTGIIEFEDVSVGWFSSHSCGGSIRWTIDQDSLDGNGNYHEDPTINSLDEIEYLEQG